MTIRFSLHTARKAQECDLCGRIVQPADGNEYWRVKGRDPEWKNPPRVICCLCHYVYGFNDDGWERAPDGREVMAALVPSETK